MPERTVLHLSHHLCLHECLCLCWTEWLAKCTFITLMYTYIVCFCLSGMHAQTWWRRGWISEHGAMAALLTIYFSIYFNNLIQELANLTSPWLFLTFKPQISFHLWVDSLILIPCLKSLSFQLSGVIPYTLFFSHRKIPKISPHWVFQLISLTSFFFLFPCRLPF